jgi:hypothetical protein
MRLSLVLCALLVTLVTACGEGVLVDEPVPGGDGSAGREGYEVVEVDPDFDDPPPVVIRLADGGTHELSPWTYCLGGGCADGMWPDAPYDVGSPAWVDVTFGLPDWTFEATFTTPRRASAPPRESATWRRVSGEVEEIGRHTFRLRPAGPAGDWHVDLFGRGPDGGDVIVTFAWTTPTDGTLPTAATARAAVLADDDGRLTSYGVELDLADLDETPTRATATIEVANEAGDRVTLDLGEPERPWSAGTVAWRGGVTLGERAARLGGKEFTYRVEVVLDGESYVGTGTWPDDTDAEITPAVPLAFTPPLPVYDGR